MRRRGLGVFACIVTLQSLAFVACGDGDAVPDGGSDAADSTVPDGRVPPPDATVPDAARDAHTDAAPDGDATVPDAPVDAAPDSASDGGSDATADGDADLDADAALPDPGPWVKVTGFAGTACNDGLRFAAAGTYFLACSTDQGLQKGSIDGDGGVTMSVESTGVSLAGTAVGMHPSNAATLYATGGATPALNRTSDSSAVPITWTTLATPSTNTYDLFAARFQPAGVGNMLGGYRRAGVNTAAAVVLAGASTLSERLVSTATGTVRSIAGSASSNLFVAVHGQAPDGTAGTGGVFRATDNATTWSAVTNGIAAADVDRAWALAFVPGTTTNMFLGVRGGASLYATTDNGANWAAMNTGLPTGAEVLSVLVKPSDTTVIFVGTTDGLYKSTDSGATFARAGLDGRSVRALLAHPTTASLVFAATNEANGLYIAK